MKLTYYGHSCLLLEIAGSSILFDPFITPNPKASGIDIAGIRPDYIFLTHGHQDHVADTVAIARSSGATVVANYEVASWFGNQGLTNLVHVNQGGVISFPFGSARVVNAVHSSSLPDGSYGGNPLGYIITSSEGSFYHSGDTALTADMKLIPEFASLTAAALCIGGHFTMGHQDAARAAGWVGAPKVVGLHYDTFPPIEINHEAAHQSFKQAGVELLLPAIGQSVDL